jgi:hypothetical protein
MEEHRILANRVATYGVRRDTIGHPYVYDSHLRHVDSVDVLWWLQTGRGQLSDAGPSLLSCEASVSRHIGTDQSPSHVAEVTRIECAVSYSCCVGSIAATLSGLFVHTYCHNCRSPPPPTPLTRLPMRAAERSRKPESGTSIS